VFGCQTLKAGETEGVDGVNGGGNEAGLGRMGMWAIFDESIEEAGVLTEETGKVWYDELVGGLRQLGGSELPKGANFGFEFPSTFRINTQVYLQWYVILAAFPKTQDSSHSAIFQEADTVLGSKFKLCAKASASCADTTLPSQQS
jgi:hypothetical protein